MRLRNILLIGLAAQVLGAADYWLAKEPALWSEMEIKRMVTDSPWAKDGNVHVKGNDVPMTSGATGGDMAGGGASPAAPRIVVRWESAAPVYEACAKGGMERYLFSCTSKLLYLSGLSKKFAEFSKDFYVLSMSNYPKIVPSGRGREAPEHSPAANAMLAQMGERIQQATFIKRKGKSPVKPANVLVVPAGPVLLVIVFVPRTDAITLEDKEVLFESTYESMEVRTRFNLGKMVYKGNLEL